MMHGGDTDITGALAAGWFGAAHGFGNAPAHHRRVSLAQSLVISCATTDSHTTGHAPQPGCTAVKSAAPAYILICVRTQGMEFGDTLFQLARQLVEASMGAGEEVVLALGAHTRHAHVALTPRRGTPRCWTNSGWNSSSQSQRRQRLLRAQQTWHQPHPPSTPTHHTPPSTPTHYPPTLIPPPLCRACRVPTRTCSWCR